MTSTAGACPRCGGPLFEGRTRDARLLGCGACGGVWLDNAASQALVTGRASDLVALAQQPSGRPGDPVDPGAGSLVCPECGEALSRVTAAGTAIELDVCPTHGTWFDAGELRVIALAHADLPPPMRFSPDDYEPTVPRFPWWGVGDKEWVFHPFGGGWKLEPRDPTDHDLTIDRVIQFAIEIARGAGDEKSSSC